MDFGVRDGVDFWILDDWKGLGVRVVGGGEHAKARRVLLPTSD